jgi:hypothetical protein
LNFTVLAEAARKLFALAEAVEVVALIPAPS